MNNAIEVIDEKYINNKTPILVKCKIDGHIWRTTPNALLKGFNCPVCAGKTIGCAPEYKNSIWSSQYRDYFSKFLSEEQMKKYMPNSCKKDWVTCPDCGKQKYIIIEQLLYQGIGCMCGDGQSFPNKFVYNILTQLNINVKPEYVPPWNKIGGSIDGQQRVMENNINIVRSLCTPDMYEVSPIMSRSTIRELSNNAEYAAYENYLHAVRMNMLTLGMEYTKALEFVNKNDTYGYYERLISAKYNEKRLII